MGEVDHLLPGYRWRILAFEDDGERVEMTSRGCIDEVVIDDWFHLEQMTDRDWWMSIGDAMVNVHVFKNGKVEVNITRGEYGDVRGRTEV